jgi:hypothetical protein
LLPYEEQAYIELELWKKNIIKKPGFFDLVSKGIQNRLNKLIENLSETAINCYRIRKVSSLKIIDHPKKSKFRLK